MALGSLALAQAIVVLIRAVDFTNGALGIAGIPLEVETSHLIWVLVVAFMLLQLAHRSHFGRAAKAVRLDERTAEGLGINVFRVRFAGFVTGSAVAGLAGALEAHRTTVISPEQYGFTTLVVVFTYALVGGNGHWLGPVLVTWGVVLIRESLDFAGTEWENIVYGILLVVVMVLAPNGLSDRSLLRGIRRRTGDVRKRVERASHEHGGDEAPTLADAGATGSSPETEAVKS
jgi:branched-chain amino acid transport system permease protein